MPRTWKSIFILVKPQTIPAWNYCCCATLNSTLLFCTYSFLISCYHTGLCPLYKSYPTVCLLSQEEWAFQVHELPLNKGLVLIHMLMVWFSSKIPDFIWEWSPSALCNPKICMFLPVSDANLMSPSWKGYKGWGAQSIGSYWKVVVCSFALCQWGD